MVLNFDKLIYLSYNVAHTVEIIIMTANAVVRARIDEHIKEEASVVLATMGLTVSDAFRILLTRVAKEKALPFEPLIPNKKTITAMRAARRGRLTTVKKLDQLLDSLNADG
jgi:DNA-damage-inducible protein J